MGDGVMSTVCFWKRNPEKFDLNPGRWVMLGKPAWWKFVVSGMVGPKVYLFTSKPFIVVAPCELDYHRSVNIMGVPDSALCWPSGWQRYKGLLGIRRLK